MPNPGKTQENKKMIGSRNFKETAELQVIEIGTAPEPLRRLEDSGVALWQRAWQMHSSWLRNTDFELLQLTCEQLDERDLLRGYVLDNAEAWHERAGLRQLEKDIQSNLIQLGFTPQARAKLGVQEVQVKSKLDELMERKANRVASTMVDPSPEA